jgi:hypothetical protein
MWGADVDQLDTLARDLSAAAASLESISRSLGGRIGAVPWLGRDAGAFRDDWQSRHAGALRVVREAVHAAAATVQANADQQRQASAAGSSGGGDRSTFRSVAGWIGDQAEDVETLANGAAVGAGAVAVAGLLMPPGANVIDVVGAGAFAAGAATVADVAGIVSIVGHGIEDPGDEGLMKDVVMQVATAGVPGPQDEIAEGLYKGATGLIGAVFD